MFLKVLHFTCCPDLFSFRTSLFILNLMFHYIHIFIIFKHINFGKHISIDTSRGKYGKNMGASVFCTTKTDAAKTIKMAVGGLGSAVSPPVGVRRQSTRKVLIIFV